MIDTFGGQLMIGAVMISASVVFHVTALVYITEWMRRMRVRLSHWRRMPRVSLVMVLSVLSIIGVHTVEAWSWAVLYLKLGEFVDLERALYFSVVTSTTLGYGDITLTEEWQLLSTFEAMGGLILFGVSTAFLLELMRQLFGHREG